MMQTFKSFRDAHSKMIRAKRAQTEKSRREEEKNLSFSQKEGGEASRIFLEIAISICTFLLSYDVFAKKKNIRLNFKWEKIISLLSF